jgi:ABC-2 type transport system ATP-binding protein
MIETDDHAGSFDYGTGSNGLKEKDVLGEEQKKGAVAVKVNNLRKNFGKYAAVNGITFEVKEGEVFGLIGPNGAGKTTTLRMLSTLLQISSGHISIFGHDVARETNEVRKMISYLPEEAGAYKNLTGRQYLEFIARFFCNGSQVKEMCDIGVEISNLGTRIDDKVDTYSKGMARRLLVARALMFRPRLAIMDELTAGLDVISAQQVRQTITKTARAGTTFVISSHNMLEVELLCERIALIDHGQIVETGTPQGLKRKYGASNIEEVFVKVVE